MTPLNHVCVSGIAGEGFFFASKPVIWESVSLFSLYSDTQNGSKGILKRLRTRTITNDTSYTHGRNVKRFETTLLLQPIWMYTRLFSMCARLLMAGTVEIQPLSSS